MKSPRALCCLLALSLLSLTSLGCQDRSRPNSARNLSIFAASSLTDVFPDLAQQFEATHPGVKLNVSFAGSQVLRLQIQQGAEFQLFASANEEHLRQLVAEKLVAGQREFARNGLVVIVPADNPHGLEDFLDIARAPHIVLADQSVPLGAYTLEFLARASQTPEHRGFAEAVKRQTVSRETNARLVRAKVELGEADAAIVYESDAVHSNKVRALPIPDDLNVEVRYFIGTSTAGARSGDMKRGAEVAEFLTFLRSPRAVQIFEKHGFRAAGVKPANRSASRNKHDAAP